jgi:hypothetical protein
MKTLLLCAAILLTFSEQPLYAQAPKNNIRPAQPRVSTLEQWHMYDSIANYSMFVGDTITAIEYFGKSLDLLPGSPERKRSLEQLKKAYRCYANSFYLKEY